MHTLEPQGSPELLQVLQYPVLLVPFLAMLCSFSAVHDELGGTDFNDHVRRLASNLIIEARGQANDSTTRAQEAHASRSIFEHFGKEATLVLDSLLLPVLAYTASGAGSFTEDELDQVSLWLDHYGQRHGLAPRPLKAKEREAELLRAVKTGLRIGSLPDTRGPDMFWAALADPTTLRMLHGEPPMSARTVRTVTNILEQSMDKDQLTLILALYVRAGNKLVASL